VPRTAATERKDAPRAARRDVTFDSGGVACRAWAYTPARNCGGAAPCIVMAHGLGGTRDCAIEPYAVCFAAAGFHVLLFDYRHLGASDGAPRQLIDIGRQLDDWAAAVRFARTMPGVDADRIGLWGTSLSGGHVLTTAARDGKIAAIAAQCPMLDGLASARMLARGGGLWPMAKLTAFALDDWLRQLTGRPPRTIALVGRPGEAAAMTTHDAYDGMRAIVPPGWRNEAAARVLLSFPVYRPVRLAGDVTCPALFITCAKDTLTLPRAAARAARSMGDRARLLEFPIGHFDIYQGQWLERSASTEAAFFREMLAP
jgi:pimeloyl-ACP methyl ester carboxylesterase